MRAILSLVLLLIGLAPAAAQSGSSLGPCSSPNYYSGQFHSGCLSATDLNNNNTAIYAAIAASGSTGQYLPITGGTLTGALIGTTGAFTGLLTAQTPSPGTSNTTVATTAFVATTFAPKASPALTGTPTAPTAALGTSTLQIATTGFVAQGFAPLASPALTGVPTAPTAAIDTSTTQIATTAFATQGRSVGAGKLVGNPATIAAASSDITVGNQLSSGIFMSSAGVLFATAPTTYYLTGQADPTGISGYYAVSRYPDTTVGVATVPARSLPGTTQTTVYKWITAPGDPGANSFAAGVYAHYIYAALSDASSVATINVQILRRAPDGTEVSVGGTTESITVSGTSPTIYRILMTRLASGSMGVDDRLVFNVRATRVSGPDPASITISVDGTASAGPSKSTVATTITGTGQYGPDYQVNVIDLGAKGDAKAAPDGVITSGSSQLCSATAGFVAADKGKNIEVNDMLGIGFAPFAGTILSVDSATCVTLSGTATATTAGVKYLQSASSEVAGTTGAYVPGDILTLQGGTFDTAAQIAVVSTRVRPDGDAYRALSIVNAGSGGRDGTVVLRGTTGTGTKFTARGTVTGGVLIDVSLFNGGIYTANPSDLANEPVTSDQTLTGAVLGIGGMDVGVLTVQTAGSYSVVPDDPIETSAGSISGASGATLAANWAQAGRFMWFTNDRQAFADAITRINSIDLAGGRAVIKVPARNYGISGAALPIATEPVLMIGDGRDQTQISVGQGYAGAHIFGFAGLFPPAIANPVGGPTLMFSDNTAGAGVSGISFSGNRFATVIPDAIILYDRNSGMYFNNIGGANIASLLRTGVLSTSTISYLRESLINDYKCVNCGIGSLTPGASRPVVWLHALGTGAKTNNLQINNGNIQLPLGPGFAITTMANDVSSASKAIEINGLRVERAPGTSGAALGDLIQIGSPADTDNVTDINAQDLKLFSPQSGGSAIAFYGTSAAARPRRIKFDNIAVTGQSLGGGINIQAGQELSFTLKQLTARSGQLITGNHTDNRIVTTVAAGSSTSAVVLAAGLGTNDAYVGGALSITVPASFTGSISAGGTMTVTAISSGRLVVGSIITGSGVRPVMRITALGTGTGGTGTYTVSNGGTQGALGSRALRGRYMESRNVTAWNGTGKVATVGALQGSSATFGFTPQAGDVASIDSLVNASIFFDDAGGGKLLDWSGLGLNVAPLISGLLYPTGVPTGTQVLAARLNLTSGVQVGPGTVPAAASDACAAGSVSWDSAYLYVCIATNTWKRSALSTWP